MITKLTAKFKAWLKTIDATSVSPIEQYLNQIKAEISQNPKQESWEIDFKTSTAVDEYYLKEALQRAKAAGVEFKIVLTTSFIMRVSFSLKEA